jgi:hypothetical protein
MWVYVVIKKYNIERVDNNKLYFYIFIDFSKSTKFRNTR